MIITKINACTHDWASIKPQVQYESKKHNVSCRIRTSTFSHLLHINILHRKKWNEQILGSTHSFIQHYSALFEFFLPYRSSDTPYKHQTFVYTFPSSFFQTLRNKLSPPMGTPNKNQHLNTVSVHQYCVCKCVSLCYMCFVYVLYVLHQS